MESVPPSTLRCLLISDDWLVQYPSFPMMEALSSPAFNMTIPESSAKVETEEGKAGVYS